MSFDAPTDIRRFADRIKLRAVTTETMPLGNRPRLSTRERALIARWVDQGARVD